MSFPEEQLPREFGKYHLIEKVATGGMAELYRAKLYGAGGFEKDLAVKKILPQLGQDQDFIQMFMDEAMITVTLNHGNIAQVLDFGEINGEYFLVMEYVDGVDLQNLLKKIAEKDEPIPTELAAYIVQEICKGLDYAHHKLGTDGEPLNIVHRDVSPQNVIISFEGQVKLVDFGIARAASRITSTQAGVVKGKMDYMSPEQLLGKGVDAKSDVWAAGVILYELLTLRKPFTGQTPQETMAAITRGVYKPPQKLNRGVSRKLAAVLKKALDGNTKKRYQTAGKMAQSLAAYLHSTGQPPSPLTLAQLLRERLPYEKPRTLNPTPVELKHRLEHRRSNPPTPVPKPDDSQEPSFAPAPKAAKTPKSTAPEFPKVNPSGPPDIQQQKPKAGYEQSVQAPEAEAISFSDLGLPGQYLEESAPDSDTKPENGESLDFDDPTLVQPTIIEQDASPAQAEDVAAVEQESKDDIADLAQAAAKILSDAPALDLPSQNEAEQEQPSPQEASDDSLASYDDDLLNAPTRLHSADQVQKQPVAKTIPPGPSRPEISEQQTIDEDQWMEQAPTAKSQDFDDEAPPYIRKPGAMLKPVLIVMSVIVAVGLLGIFVWNPFGNAEQVTDTNLPTPMDKKPKLQALKNKTEEPKQPKTASVQKTKTELATKPVSPGPSADMPKTKPANKDGKAVDSRQTQPPLVVPGKSDDSKQKTEAVTKNEQESAVKKHKKLVNKNRKKKAKVVKHHKKSHPKVAMAKGFGTLKINSEPFSVVYWKGKRLGPTPQMNIRLPSGSHTLELKNEALGLSRRVRVRIEPNKVQTVFVQLRR